MSPQSPLDGIVARRSTGKRIERCGIASTTERRAGLTQRPLPDMRCRCGPRCAVPGTPVAARLRAERDQLGEVGDGGDLTEGGDAREPARVEVVTEHQRGVAILGLEDPRPSVMDEVALVDGLEAEREARLRQRREHGLELAVGGLPQRREELRR